MWRARSFGTNYPTWTSGPCAFLPGAKEVLVGAPGYAIERWRVRDLVPLARYQCKYGAEDLLVSADGARVFVSTQGSLGVIALPPLGPDARPIERPETPPNAPAVDQPFSENGIAASSLAATPDGRFLFAAGRGSTRAHCLDAFTGDVLRTFTVETPPGNSFGMLAVAVSPDGAVLATADDGGTWESEMHGSSPRGAPAVRIWDCQRGGEITRLDLGGEVHALAFSPDGSRLAAACHSSGDAHGLHLIQTARWEVVARCVEPFRPHIIGHMAFADDELLVAAGGRGAWLLAVGAASLHVEQTLVTPERPFVGSPSLAVAENVIAVGKPPQVVLFER